MDSAGKPAEFFLNLQGMPRVNAGEIKSYVGESPANKKAYTKPPDACIQGAFAVFLFLLQHLFQSDQHLFPLKGLIDKGFCADGFRFIDGVVIDQ